MKVVRFTKIFSPYAPRDVGGFSDEEAELLTGEGYGVEVEVGGEEPAIGMAPADVRRRIWAERLKKGYDRGIA